MKKNQIFFSLFFVPLAFLSFPALAAQGINSTEGADLPLGASNTEYMRITKDGNIGVGTQTPKSKLEIDGGIKIGADNDTCTTNKIGTLRYNSALDRFEGCRVNGGWQGLDGNIPVGSILFVYAATCPTGWVVADGSLGGPDLRGVFIRGLDMGRGADEQGAARAVGSYQEMSVQPHSHFMPTWNGVAGTYSEVSMGINYGYDYYPEHPTSTYGNNIGAFETRPRNVALLPCIKVN